MAASLLILGHICCILHSCISVCVCLLIFFTFSYKKASTESNRESFQFRWHTFHLVALAWTGSFNTSCRESLDVQDRTLSLSRARLGLSRVWTENESHSRGHERVGRLSLVSWCKYWQDTFIASTRSDILVLQPSWFITRQWKSLCLVLGVPNCSRWQKLYSYIWITERDSLC